MATKDNLKIDDIQGHIAHVINELTQMQEGISLIIPRTRDKDVAELLRTMLGMVRSEKEVLNCVYEYNFQ